MAHSVMEELILFLCNEESEVLISLSGVTDESEEGICTEEWVFDLFDDMDIIHFLYSDVYLESDHPYHFSHWNDPQFFIESIE